ncbi:hypothetical protein [Mycolicibacterium phlei]|uniref:hypothetical protein n=1 Tax=Mycolicibacterium phlei TaxID=1771 RepID=UPI000314302C|nr:hypothetical protein [Mycolicibacterium phlei]MBF4194653.1 hypothetical protein [Mycolicibacterium phlei]
MSTTTPRLTVVALAEAHGWRRIATPDVDVFVRGETEVTVAYHGADRDRIAAANIGETGRAARYPADPRDRAGAITRWLTA